jgi:hypothetical protein
MHHIELYGSLKSRVGFERMKRVSVLREGSNP